MILPFPPDPTHTPILRPISPHPSSSFISTTYPRWTPKTCRGNPLSSPLGMESHENRLQTLHLSTCYNIPYTVLYPVCSQYVIAILIPHLCSEPHLIPYCIHQPLPPSPNPTFPHFPQPVNFNSKRRRSKLETGTNQISLFPTSILKIIKTKLDS